MASIVYIRKMRRRVKLNNKKQPISNKRNAPKLDLVQRVAPKRKLPDEIEDNYGTDASNNENKTSFMVIPKNRTINNSDDFEITPLKNGLIFFPSHLIV